MKQVAILGCGIVGSGVAGLLESNAAQMEQAVGEPVRLKYVVEKRDCSGKPWADRVTDDFSRVETDPEVTVVAECIGGAGIAYEFVRRCLLAGKSVVTSNKQLVAEKGLELLAIAREKGVHFYFEASVGGGIPLLRPLTTCLAANRIEAVYGIVNGTTNFILTKMLEDGAAFPDALAEAQRLGYAEADPTDDVEGVDALRKLCILADLSFGSNVPPEKIPAEGIRAVTAADAAFAGRLGCAVRLLAYGKRLENDRFTAFVAPFLVPRESLLAHVRGVMNAVAVRGDAVGECLFYGAGAGSVPTASAVAGDIIDALRGDGRRIDAAWGPERPERLADPALLPWRWYIRTMNGCGSDLLEQCVSDNGECAGVTRPMTLPELEENFRGMELLSRFRLLD